MKKLLVVIALSLFSACGDTIVDDPDWPEYKERLVVNAVVHIYPDSTRAYCDVRRTMPLNQAYNIDAARIDNTEVRLHVGDSTYAFKEWNTKYPNSYRITFATRDQWNYLLSVRSGSKYVQGQLQIPAFSSELDSVYQMPSPTDTSLTLVVFRQHVLYNHEYGWGVCLYDADGNEHPYFYGQPLWSHQDTPNTGRTVERSIEYPKGFYKKARYQLQIYSTEFNASNNGNSGDDGIFGGGGRNPRFNISGDGFGYITYSFYGKEIDVPLK